MYLPMKTNQQSFFNQKGFSLTEMIVTVVFISVALIALLNTFNVGLRSAADSNSMSLSTQIAETKMERIKSDKASFGLSYLIHSNYLQEDNPDGCSGYTRTVTITNYENYKKIEVAVTHNSFPSITLVTLFSNY